jgi:hypothetical protein
MYDFVIIINSYHFLACTSKFLLCISFFSLDVTHIEDHQYILKLSNHPEYFVFLN